MTYGEFVARQAEVFGSSRFVMRELLDAMFADVCFFVQRDGRFSVPGFGVFEKRPRGKKRVVAPDGTVSMLKPRVVLGFRASRTVRL